MNKFGQVNCNAVVMTGAMLPKGTKVDCCAVWSKPVIAKPNEVGDPFF